MELRIRRETSHTRKKAAKLLINAPAAALNYQDRLLSNALLTTRTQAILSSLVAYRSSSSTRASGTCLRDRQSSIGKSFFPSCCCIPIDTYYGSHHSEGHAREAAWIHVFMPDAPGPEQQRQTVAMSSAGGHRREGRLPAAGPRGGSGRGAN